MDFSSSSSSVLPLKLFFNTIAIGFIFPCEREERSDLISSRYRQNISRCLYIYKYIYIFADLSIHPFIRLQNIYILLDGYTEKQKERDSLVWWPPLKTFSIRYRIDDDAIDSNRTTISRCEHHFHLSVLTFLPRFHLPCLVEKALLFSALRYNYKVDSVVFTVEFTAVSFVANIHSKPKYRVEDASADSNE